MGWSILIECLSVWRRFGFEKFACLGRKDCLGWTSRSKFCEALYLLNPNSAAMIQFRSLRKKGAFVHCSSSKVHDTRNLEGVHATISTPITILKESRNFLSLSILNDDLVMVCRQSRFKRSPFIAINIIQHKPSIELPIRSPYIIITIRKVKLKMRETHGIRFLIHSNIHLWRDAIFTTRCVTFFMYPNRFRACAIALPDVKIDLTWNPVSA